MRQVCRHTGGRDAQLDLVWYRSCEFWSVHEMMLRFTRIAGRNSDHLTRFTWKITIKPCVCNSNIIWLIKCCLSSLLLLQLPADLWHFLTCHVWGDALSYNVFSGTLNPTQSVSLGWYSRWGAVMACLHRKMVWLRTQSHVSRVYQNGFPLPSLQFSSSWVSFSYGGSSLTADAFLWPHCLQPAVSFWCRLCVSGLQDAARLHVVSRSTLVGLWFNTVALSFGPPDTICLHHPPYGCCCPPPWRGSTGNN